MSYDALIDGLKAKKIDLLDRTVPFEGGEVRVCYIGQLVDRNALSSQVIKPLTEFCAVKRHQLDAPQTAALVYSDQLRCSHDAAAVENYLLRGWAVLLFTSSQEYLAVDVRQVTSRQVDKPELMYALRGARDAFVENLDTNLSLLRYRLKDGNLRVEKREVGSRTKSVVAVVYIQDIARPELVMEVNKRLEAIHVDPIYESGELQSFLEKNRYGLLPELGIIERSDMAVEALLEGRVVILVDGSCIALQAPKVFVEYLYSCDDRYENKYFSFLMRLIRYMALFLSLTATSVYIALAEFHPDAMPASYIISFAQMRSRAPFSATIAVLSLEFIVELMREALLRVPVKIGSAIAIVGGIIIGQAASASGFYTSLLLILVSIGFLASFAIPDITLSNTMRILKFFFIAATGLFGFYGFSLAVTFMLAILVSKDSFGIPYFAPWAPFNFGDFIRSFMYSKSRSPQRQRYLRNKDKTRMEKEK